MRCYSDHRLNYTRYGCSYPMLMNTASHYHLLLYATVCDCRDGMQIAARNGSLDVMRLLYDNGGDLLTSGKTGDTLFHLAAANGHVNVMIWMNSIGGLATCVNRYGQTPAHIAARRGEVGVLKYLHHELCVDVQQEDFDGQTPLQLVPRHSMYGNDQSVQEAREFLISLLDIDGKG